jgi:hypothetical protein
MWTIKNLAIAAKHDVTDKEAIRRLADLGDVAHDYATGTHKMTAAWNLATVHLYDLLDDTRIQQHIVSMMLAVTSAVRAAALQPADMDARPCW